MKKQSEIFREGGEGDRWFFRNQGALGAKNDPVVDYLRGRGQGLGVVAEVGCADGWRLFSLARLGLCSMTNCHGIDPSAAAIANGIRQWPQLNLSVGTAESIALETASVDTLIFGFCLYLVDINDLFKVAAESNRVLASGGRIVIFDFMTKASYKNKYVHRDGVYSHKMDFSKMFEWHPDYLLESRISYSHSEIDRPSIPVDLDEWVGISVLKKRES